MKSLVLSDQKNNLLSQRRLLLWACGFLTIMSILLGISNLCLIGHERIIVVPPVVSGKFWIAEDAVSDSYLEQMADFWGSLLLNANEANFQLRASQLLEHTDPENYAAMKAMLTEQEQYMAERGMSTSFNSASFQIDREKMLVTVKGQLRVNTGSQLLEAMDKKFTVQFGFKNGRIYVKKFEDVKEG